MKRNDRYTGFVKCIEDEQNKSLIFLSDFARKIGFGKWKDDFNKKSVFHIFLQTVQFQFF